MENSDKNEILTAINTFSTNVDRRFDGVESRLDGVESRLDGVESRLDGVESRLNGVESRLSKVESTMVTKDYLDEKLADLRGDLNVLIRKEDHKLQTLITILVEEQVISQESANRVLSQEPFAKLIP